MTRQQIISEAEQKGWKRHVEKGDPTCEEWWSPDWKLCLFEDLPNASMLNLPMMDIPRDKTYPIDAVQCDDCGGHGCITCYDKGWLPKGHPKGRKCYLDACTNPIPPNQVAIYCSNDCAMEDAL